MVVAAGSDPHFRVPAAPAGIRGVKYEVETHLGQALAVAKANAVGVGFPVEPDVIFASLSSNQKFESLEHVGNPAGDD